jgi:hypothetical protein
MEGKEKKGPENLQFMSKLEFETYEQKCKMDVSKQK